MPERRIAAIAVTFASGIIAAEYASVPVCAACAALALLTLYIFTRDTSLRTTAAILTAVFLTGSARYAVSMQVPKSDISNTREYVLAFEGQVISDPESVSDHVRLVFRARRVQVANGWRKVSGCVMIDVYPDKYGEMHELQYGDRARISAVPYPPSEPTNPGQFSWRSYLARQGIYTCASVKRPSQVHIIGSGGNPITRAAYWARDYLVSAIHRTHPKQEASVVAGIALGTYSYLPQDILRDFSNTGTLHILAASGYNCFILLFIFGWILKVLGMLPKKRGLLVIALIGFYLLMLGPKPSLVRAAVMCSLLLLAIPLHRAPNIRSIFFATAFIVLMFRPTDLFDVGFQLSFLAVGALIWVSPVISALFAVAGLTPISPKHSPNRRIHMWLHRKLIAPSAATAIATITITLVTQPIVAYHFNYISLSSVPANVAVAIFEPVVFADGFISAAVAPLGPIGQGVGYIGGLVTRAMLEVVGYLGAMQYSAISVSSPPVAAIIGYYLVLFAILSYIRSRIDEKKA